MGKKLIYKVDRVGERSTSYFYDNLNEALNKYDEVCKRKNYLWVDLNKFPVNGKYFMESVYTTQTNIANVKYRNIAKRK